MVLLGFKPWTAMWYARTNPLSNAGRPLEPAILKHTH